MKTLYLILSVFLTITLKAQISPYSSVVPSARYVQPIPYEILAEGYRVKQQRHEQRWESLQPRVLKLNTAAQTIYQCGKENEAKQIIDLINMVNNNYDYSDYQVYLYIWEYLSKLELFASTQLKDCQ